MRNEPNTISTTNEMQSRKYLQVSEDFYSNISIFIYLLKAT